MNNEDKDNLEHIEQAYWDEYDDYDSYNDEDLWNEDDEDSGFLGSMLEAQLTRNGQIICPDCKKKVSSILNKENPNWCKNELHQSFKQVFDIRIQIGLHDLKTRGFD